VQLQRQQLHNQISVVLENRTIKQQLNATSSEYIITITSQPSVTVT
jgi:hypothetical protein